jgi:hypothetical protein
LRWSGSPSGVVRTAASPASATCSPDTRRPTGSARGAGGSPRDRGPTASSNSHRLSSSTGSRIWSRRRGSTGTGITGCSPRITSSGPPSRRSLSGGDWLVFRVPQEQVPVPGCTPRYREGTGSCSVFRRNRCLSPAAPPRLHPAAGKGRETRETGTGTDCCAAGASPSHDTSRIAWAKLMARVGEEFPLECPGCGGDIRLIALHPSRGRSGRSSRIWANRSSLRQSLPPVARPPTGESSSRSTTTGRFFRRHPSSCPRSTSTASDRCRTPGHDKAPRRPDSERLRAATRKTPLQGRAGPIRGAAFRAGAASECGSGPLTSRSCVGRRLRKCH